VCQRETERESVCVCNRVACLLQCVAVAHPHQMAYDIDDVCMRETERECVCVCVVVLLNCCSVLQWPSSIRWHMILIKFVRERD